MAQKLILIALELAGMVIHPFQRERICVYNEDNKLVSFAYGERPISKIWR